MNAAQINGYGDTDVMKTVSDAVRPVAGEGKVLVAVHAAAINPFDLKVLEGAVRDMADLTFPAVLGGDCAGVVAEVGPGVQGFVAGQEVYGQADALSGHGSFAEFTPVKASQLASKPANIDYLAAATAPLVASSAHQALIEHMNLQAGQRILIHGGAGGIGSMAIQIAKHLGALVATTATGDDIEYVKELGADEVSDYKSEDFSQRFHDYDAVLDTIGGETNTKSYEVLKPGGILVSMVAEANDELVAKHNLRYVHQSTQVTTERLSAIAKLIDDGVLKINVGKVFPLAQAAEAFAYQKTGRPHGKVVLQITG